jgi:hypothetical protein
LIENIGAPTLLQNFRWVGFAGPLEAEIKAEMPADFKLLRTLGAREKAPDRHQNHGPDRGRGQAADKSVGRNPQALENPSAQDGTHKPEKDIRDQPETTPARYLAAQPARNQADDEPTDQAGMH